MQIESNTAQEPAFRRTPMTIVASDVYPLGATLFEPRSGAHGTVVLHGATATPARFYTKFAEFLCERGLRVVTYDYRGVGGSRPDTLRGFRATMTDWARVDARSVHRYVAERFPGEPVVVVGHSFGGQLLGLLDDAHSASGALLVAAQLGYYGHWPVADQLRLGVIWHGLVPMLTTALGYLPGKAGLGEDLPAGVAREWAKWCTSPEYLITHVPDAAERFARFASPVRFYSFTDDDYAPKAAVEALVDRFRRAPVDHRVVVPEEHGGKPIGHFGFFRPRFRQTLWSEAADFLSAMLEQRAPSPAPWTSFGIGLEDVMADLQWGRS